MIPAQRWERVKELFASALALEAEGRPAFLAEQCGPDETLCGEVESLLAAHAAARGFLDADTAGPALPAPAEAMVGRRVGPYRLVGLIGRGGMGEVCLAVRDDDQFQKLVAVKLIRRGLDDASMQIRFRAERQILARLEHPGIARLIDAGATEEGWPFFVMEHVEGQRIDAYADAARLDIRARLALFRSVCAAVQYAHQNLVVHRDIKPANILVTSDGQPKLLDFGVAKLLGPEAAGQTTSTAFGPLTPAYASPEQILGQPVSTATDVYSLGVLLYELLTGRSPYDAPRGRPMELLTAVVEQEPQGSGLHGDLDDVLMMALRKEPSRRYPSVEAFSEDVRRYLAGLPVAARKGTWSYRTGKFIRRNRLPLAAVAAVLALGAALAVSTAVQARRVARERDKAERVSEFLVGLFTVADPRRPPDTALTAREMLDQGAARIESELAGEPEVQAALMYTMGRVYWRLGVYDQAVLLLEKSLSTRRRVLGRDHRDVAASLQTLGNVLVNKGDHAAAEPMLAEALAIRRRMRPVDPLELAGSLTALGNLLNDRGEFRGAEPLYREALDLRRGALGGQHMQVARSLNNMALVRENLGDYAEAEALHREALAMRRALLGADHPEVARSLNNLGSVLLRKGDVAGAEAALREALASKRRLLGDGHPDVAHSANNLANVLLRRPDYAGAEALYREALAIHRQRLGNEHPEIALFLMNIARALRGKGDAAGSESLHREALAMSRRLLGNGHPNVASSLSNLADLLCERGRAREGESMLREALEILRKTVPAGHPHIAEAEKNLAACGTAPTVGAAAARRP